MHGVLENPNIGPTDSLNCFRLQYKFPQNSFSKSPPLIQTSGQEALLISQEVNELLQKGAIHKTPFTRDSFLTAACFLYSKRIFASGDMFFEQVHCKRAFPDGKH